MGLKKAVTVIFCLVTCFGYSQSSEAEKLLNQAEEIVSYNPVEAVNITEHTLKNTNDDQIRIRSLYLGAMAYYVTGSYDTALNKAFEARALAQSAHNTEFEQKSSLLISRIFKFLGLKEAGTEKPVRSEPEAPIFKTEDLTEKAYHSLYNNRTDSARYFAESIKKDWKEGEPGYRAALYYGLLGDIAFVQKNIESSLLNYKKAAAISERLGNPFLNERFNDRLSAGFLAADSLVQFQKSSELSKNYSMVSAKIETSASNEAHRLRIGEMDRHYREDISLYRNLMWLLAGLAVSAILLKLIFFVRNRNRLKMFEKLFSYLKNREELKEVMKQRDPVTQIEERSPEPFTETAEPVKTETAEENTPPKTSSLLKESEDQILAALEKFEVSGKFTNRDMSLSKLAAQLNTNNKYLSEVINRHKGKNFNAYINKLRIDYITEKMREDPAYLHYKVSYLAEECGYSSHSTFTTVFKSIVGVSPIMFVDFIREESKHSEISK